MYIYEHKRKIKKQDYILENKVEMDEGKEEEGGRGRGRGEIVLN